MNTVIVKILVTLFYFSLIVMFIQPSFAGSTTGSDSLPSTFVSSISLTELPLNTTLTTLPVSLPLFPSTVSPSTTSSTTDIPLIIQKPSASEIATNDTSNDTSTTYSQTKTVPVPVAFNGTSKAYSQTVPIQVTEKTIKNHMKSESILGKTSVIGQQFDAAVAGDWGCNEDTSSTVQNIAQSKPALVLSTGDMSYQNDGGCFFDVMKPIEKLVQVSFGNHDEESEEHYLNFYDLPHPFYSVDYKNVHYLFMNSNDKSEDGDQYQFVLKDLETQSKNPKIEWTIVVHHMPYYTNPGHHAPDSEAANIYHPLFDKYGVDLVVAGHNHWYERTLPLKYNEKSAEDPLLHINDIGLNENQDKQSDKISSVAYQSAASIDINLLDGNAETIDKKIKGTYIEPENPIFVTVGTGGKEQYKQDGSAPYVARAYDTGFGFLGLKITSESIIGEFYAEENGETEDYILRDKFTIVKENLHL